MTLRVILMGVSGCGKSSVGAALSAALAVPYLDGDDLHPAANVADNLIVHGAALVGNVVHRIRRAAAKDPEQRDVAARQAGPSRAGSELVGLGACQTD